MSRLHRALACLGALAAASSCGRTQRDIQRDFARERLAPARIDAQRAPEPQVPVRVASVVAYADAELRRDPRWERRLESLVARANAFLEPELGLRLEVRDVRPWERSASIEDMPAVLAELERLDAGQSSDFVVGISGSAPLVTATFDRLGMAKLLRPVFLLRALDHAQEAADFAKSLPDLSSLELDRLARESLQHKELVVFLHELGHAAGVPHLHTSGSLMNPAYDRTLSAYGRLGLRLLREGLPLALERRASPERRAALEAALRRAVESSSPEEWDGAGRAELLALLGAGRSEPAGGAVVLPPEEARAFNAAAELANAGKPREAWERLEPRLFPESHPALWRLACQLGAAPASGVGEKAWVACRRAASRDPADALPLLLLSDLLIAAGDRSGALEAAEQAAARLGSQSGAAPERWAMLANLFHRLDALSASERCAERAAPDQRRAILERSQEMRRAACLASPAGGPPLSAAQESELVDALRRGWEKAQSGRLEEARALADEAGRASPAVAGPRALRCEIERRSGRRARARGECEAAIAAHGECLPALQIAGVMALEDRAFERAERLLRKALALAPEEPSTRQNLAAALRAQGRLRELAELEASRPGQAESGRAGRAQE